MIVRIENWGFLGNVEELKDLWGKKYDIHWNDGALLFPVDGDAKDIIPLSRLVSKYNVMFHTNKDGEDTMLMLDEQGKAFGQR